MPLSLYLIRQPRTLVLVSSDYSLLFKPAPASKASDAGSVSIVMELLERDEVDLESAVLLHSRVSGCLGVLAVGNGASSSVLIPMRRADTLSAETFLSIITHAIPLGSTYSRPFDGPGTEPINRILAVDFFCLTSPSFDYLHAPISSADSYSTSLGNDSFEDAASLASPSSSSLRAEPTPTEHPCQGIRKILSNSSFYFSSGPEAFDLSTRLPARLEKAPQGKAAPEAADRGGGGVDDEPNPDGYEAAEIDHDARFLWNTYLVAPILSFRSSLPLNLREEFDRQGFMVLAIQGYAGTYDITLGGEPAVLSLISRLGWKRSGTRFNVRGVDDDGSVANFVEVRTRHRPSLAICRLLLSRRKQSCVRETCASRMSRPEVAFLVSSLWFDSSAVTLANSRLLQSSGKKAAASRSTRRLRSPVRSKPLFPPSSVTAKTFSSTMRASTSSISFRRKKAKRRSPTHTRRTSRSRRRWTRMSLRASASPSLTSMLGAKWAASRASSRSCRGRSAMWRKTLEPASSASTRRAGRRRS